MIASIQPQPISMVNKALAFVTLSKPRVLLLVILNTAAGFILGVSGTCPYSLMLWTLFATALLAAGVAALNQYLERKRDCLMQRTANRPLPSGRLTPREALVFALAFIAFAEFIFFARVAWLDALLGAVVVLTYDGIYTPLKAHAWLSTLIGAIPGALPAPMGWVAVRGRWGAPALILFSILFLWQLPHVLAIATLYRTGYSKAGINLLPLADSEYALTSWEMIFINVLLILVSILPIGSGMTGKVYIVPASILGVVYLWGTVRLAKQPTKLRAARLLRVSVLYLPLLLIAMIICRKET